MKQRNIPKTILKTIGIIILIIVLLFTYGYTIGTKGLKIKEYKVIDKNLPNDFYGLKIVHISDIHYGYYYDIKKLKKLVTKINKLNPDIIVLTGDLIDKDPSNEEEKQEIIKTLNKLNSNIKMYAIKGNLDSSSFDEIIDKTKFTNLNDTYDIIYSKNDKILISGLSANLNGSQSVQDKLDSTYKYLDENNINFKILLMHEPDYIEKIKSKTFNLVLAGHSHNGQVNLPIIGVIKTPKGSKKYYKEYYETKYGKLYISSGIGTSVLPIRISNPPSINFYRLTNK